MQEPYHTLDERRIIALAGDHEKTLLFAVDHWIEVAERAIKDHDFFAVALSGGSTPKKIFQFLSSPETSKRVDWTKVYLFWSDERSVPPTDPESNFHMAMEEGGLAKLPIPKKQIFRMVAEEDIEKNAKAYENIILEKLNGHSFDLIMLGMGDDGHTASLFPHTAAISAKNELVVANFVPQKKAWRMTFTYECINSASHICIYVLGANKAEILQKVLTSPLSPEELPSQLIGTNDHPALWIVDFDAGKNLLSHLK